MGRTALSSTKTIIVAAIVVVAGLGGGLLYKSAYPAKKTIVTSVVSTTPTKTTLVSYDGIEGKTALEIFKTKATVVTKTATGLGEYVISVNGNDGGGTKYWLFFVNGKEAEVGAGSYITHSNDKIEWKLQ